MLDTGQVIADRYELLKQLGRGGFSEYMRRVWGLTMPGFLSLHKNFL